MYETEIYHKVKYPIENIYEAIEFSWLSKASIPHGDHTLNIYDVGDEGYNIFVLDGAVNSHLGITATEAIDFIQNFLNT